MGVDLSQLTLPQIAAAVAAGDLRLVEAEAELSRRPATSQPRWQGAYAGPPPSRGPSPADLMNALERTRREVRKATRNLKLLTDRLETLAQQVSSFQPARPARTHTPDHRQRTLRIGPPRWTSGPQPPEEPPEADVDEPSQIIAA